VPTSLAPRFSLLPAPRSTWHAIIMWHAMMHAARRRDARTATRPRHTVRVRGTGYAAHGTWNTVCGKHRTATGMLEVSACPSQSCDLVILLSLSRHRRLAVAVPVLLSPSPFPSAICSRSNISNLSSLISSSQRPHTPSPLPRVLPHRPLSPREHTARHAPAWECAQAIECGAHPLLCAFFRRICSSQLPRLLYSPTVAHSCTYGTYVLTHGIKRTQEHIKPIWFQHGRKDTRERARGIVPEVCCCVLV
jgi:hypothetical protein